MNRNILKTKPYFIISVDYEGCFGYYSEDNCCYSCDDDILELEGYENTPFHVKGLEKWCYEWNDAMLRTNAGEQADFNWDDWKRRGLDLSQRLRQILPEQISLYFRKNGKDILIEKISFFKEDDSYASYHRRLHRQSFIIEKKTGQILTGRYKSFALSACQLRLKSWVLES